MANVQVISERIQRSGGLNPIFQSANSHFDVPRGEGKRDYLC